MKEPVKIILFSLALLTGFNSLAQQKKAVTTLEELKDSTEMEDEFSEIIRNTMEAYYKEIKVQKNKNNSVPSFGYKDTEIPSFSDSIYIERIAELNEKSPFKIDVNNIVLDQIKLFAEKEQRRKFASVVMGRSKLYFDLFEQKLAKNNLPLELKYLAVIESGLRPQVKSHAGALGLWQFMFQTGKMYGLNQNSYVDERMDPEKSTEAACQYLKKLHDIYQDWNLALAAYNAGPGNINKAIWRSGGKKTFWEIRPYLTKETQNYVPNFIAMYYVLSYPNEHNIQPMAANYHRFELDTLCLHAGLHMKTIDSLIGWNLESIKELNPIYKTTYIPKTSITNHCINIPHNYVNKWISLEDSLYALDSAIYISPKIKIPAKETNENAPLIVYHKVEKGQNLGQIARKHGTTVNNLMSWNHMRSTNISVGQRLKIYKGATPSSGESIAKEGTTSPSKTENPVLYTIQSGENLWAIATQQDTTVENLMRLNPGINSQHLKVGQKIRIR